MSAGISFGLAPIQRLVPPSTRKDQRPPNASSEDASLCTLPLSSAICVKGGVEKYAFTSLMPDRIAPIDSGCGSATTCVFNLSFCPSPNVFSDRICSTYICGETTAGIEILSLGPMSFSDLASGLLVTRTRGLELTPQMPKIWLAVPFALSQAINSAGTP